MLWKLQFCENGLLSPLRPHIPQCIASDGYVVYRYDLCTCVCARARLEMQHVHKLVVRGLQMAGLCKRRAKQVLLSVSYYREPLNLEEAVFPVSMIVVHYCMSDMYDSKYYM